MDWYKSNGYQFVALSDHNILAQGEKWVTIADLTVYQTAFSNYLEGYGSDWVEHRTDSSGLQVKLKTYEEYKPLFEENQKFLIIQSEEITDRFENKPLHLNATNLQNLINPQGGNSVAEVLQNNINQVLDQRERTQVPMLPHINHPNFGYAITLDDMISLQGERFFEVYNGHPSVHNLGDSAHMSTERMWDLINASYIENQKPLMYGLATDDSHHYHVQDSKWSNAGRGWIMVRADSLTPGSLIAAMEAGEFYASTGVELKKIQFEKNLLSIEIAPEAGIIYKISFVGCEKDQSEPVEFKAVKGTKAEFKLTDNVLFVRCKIISSKLQKNPVENMKFEMAWTQPVTVSSQRWLRLRLKTGN